MAKHTSDVNESNAVEAPDLEAAAEAPRHGFFVRLYTGTGAFEVIGRRKLWYAISGLIVAICIASIVIRGFTFGIDFEGGTKVSMPVDRGDGHRQRPAGRRRVQQDAGQGHRIGRGRRQRRFGHGADPVGDADQSTDRTTPHRAVRRVPAQGRRRQAQQAGHQRLRGVGDLGRSDHQEGASGPCGVPGAGGPLHHRSLRALHGHFRNGDTGFRPGRHRRGVLAGRVRGHPGNRDRPADHPGLLACTTP